MNRQDSITIRNKTRPLLARQSKIYQRFCTKAKRNEEKDLCFVSKIKRNGFQSIVYAVGEI